MEAKPRKKRRKSIITKKDGVPIIDPKKSLGSQIKKLAKPKKKKVWLTVQMPVELRNEVSKASLLLQINVSKYIRKKLIELVNAAKTGRVPNTDDFVEYIPKATIDTSLDKQL